jgi:hypothetical protein
MNFGIYLFFQKYFMARCWWFMPVIQATQAAEIRRIRVQSQPWANSSRDLEKPITKKGCGVAQVPNK